MKPNFRRYGTPPFNVVVLHGGPGSAGGMMPLAQLLAPNHGVLEPIQRASSIAGQIEELKNVLETHADSPVTLIGHSWGAWLGYLFCAKHPVLTKKLIMVASGGFEEKYAAQTQKTRFSRLSKTEREEVGQLLEIFKRPSTGHDNDRFLRLGELFFKVDAYDPLPQQELDVELDIDIYKAVWGEATRLRRSGELLERGKQISTPVLAIHGDYDSHAYAGVQTPLADVLENFRFILLPNCGHKPWIERQARDRFLNILEEELSLS
ncbi:MAG: alpha/beta hydrolase [Desulfuromonadaceae bacterium]|jgi:pimeloyl-ACP methyl ester carboxylesterase